MTYCIVVIIRSRSFQAVAGVQLVKQCSVGT
jgi:hypothetical protein